MPDRWTISFRRARRMLRQSSIIVSLSLSRRRSWPERLKPEKIPSFAMSSPGTAYHFHANVPATSQHTFERSCGHSKVCCRQDGIRGMPRGESRHLPVEVHSWRSRSYREIDIVPPTIRQQAQHRFRVGNIRTARADVADFKTCLRIKTNHFI